MARKTKTLTPIQLLATPRHMLAWLREKPPRAIVTRDILSNSCCLGANFLADCGHGRDVMGGYITSGHLHGWFADTINLLDGDEPITARRAISAIAKATAASRTRRAP